MPDSPTSEPESEFVCACEEWMRSACASDFIYSDAEGKRYCVLHFPGKEKSADFEAALQKKLESKDFDFRGVWFPNRVSFTKFEFTAPADFGHATFSAEAEFDHASFNSATNFFSATFSGATNFFSSTFSAEADFRYATFRAEAGFSCVTFRAEAFFFTVTFGAAANFSDTIFRAEASFNCSTFNGAADFSNATFSIEARFHAVVFNAPADFDSATFSGLASFPSTTFSAEADFTNAIFSGLASFRDATFADYARFAAGENQEPFRAASSLNLQSARIEKSERVSFHTLTLHPHWFINIDPRKFDFINVHWNNSGNAKPELELLIAKEVSPDKTPKSAAESSGPTDSDKTRKDQITKLHRLLAIACQRLAANCEENGRYRSASHFRRMAMDAQRLETWRGFDFRRLNWWFWLASGYGERPFQALMMLIAILVLFGALYTQVGFARWEPRLASEAEAVVAKKDDSGAPLNFRRALTYSAAVMTLQRPEPKPATTTAQTFVLLETILGPVQAALLALAIRRKFMR